MPLIPSRIRVIADLAGHSHQPALQNHITQSRLVFFTLCQSNNQLIALRLMETRAAMEDSTIMPSDTCKTSVLSKRLNTLILLLTQLANTTKKRSKFTLRPSTMSQLRILTNSRLQSLLVQSVSQLMPMITSDTTLQESSLSAEQASTMPLSSSDMEQTHKELSTGSSETLGAHHGESKDTSTSLSLAALVLVVFRLDHHGQQPELLDQIELNQTFKFNH